jgi:hypothetical protein
LILKQNSYGALKPVVGNRPNMTTRIPSLLLARLQVMFTSGMTLKEVTEALDLEIAEEAVKGAAEEKTEEPTSPAEVKETEVPPSVDSEKLPPAVLNHLFALVRAVQKLGADSYALAGHEDVRSSESLAEISKSLGTTTQSVAKLVNVISSFAPDLNVDSDDAEPKAPAVSEKS